MNKKNGTCICVLTKDLSRDCERAPCSSRPLAVEADVTSQQGRAVRKMAEMVTFFISTFTAQRLITS